MALRAEAVDRLARYLAVSRRPRQDGAFTADGMTVERIEAERSRPAMSVEEAERKVEQENR